MPPHRILALLLALYPRRLRREYDDDLRALLGAAWREECQRRPRLGACVAVTRAVVDAIRAHVGSRAEARWNKARGPRFGPRDERRRPRDERHGLRAETHGPRAARASDLAADVRYALRTFRRSPGFFAGVLATLALGVGANTAVFSLVKAVVLQPLPYERPDELVMLWRSPVVMREFWRYQTTPRFLLAWRERAADVVTVAGVKGYGNLDADMDIVGESGAERLRGAFATPNFFEVLGARPFLGRVFTSADEAAGRTDLVVLGHAVWTTTFGADPEIVGRRITLTTGSGRTRAPQTFIVAGVLGPAFRFNYPEDVQVWVPRPWAAVAGESPNAIGWQVIGRLRPAVSFDIASQRLATLHDLIRPTESSVPIANRQTTRLERVSDWVAGDTRPMLTLLAAVALLLFVVTCATAANALFIRVSERQRELALRTALGASRTRLLRQLIVEGAALAAAGTAAGLLLAMLLLPALRAVVPPSVPRGDEIALDLSLLWFAAAAAASVTLLAALAPAWRGARLDVAGGLKRSAASVSADRATTIWRRGLMGLQACLASALLVTAGLLLASFWRLVHEPLGFSAGDVLAIETRVLGLRDPATAANRLRALQRDLVARVSAVPGVAAVSLTSAVPFRGVDWYRSYFIDQERSVGGNERQVDPAFFGMMRIPLRRGRLFTAEDGHGAPLVAVVSESFARRAFGDEDPIGRPLRQEYRDSPVRVVGVVGDVRYARFNAEPTPAVYLPREQTPSELICLLIQTRSAGLDVAPAVRAAIRSVDPTLPAMNLATVNEILDESLADRRFYTTAAAAFAGLAVLLTVAGLVVIVMRAVVERRRELAIRSALGASAARLQAGVVRHGLVPVTTGVIAGLLLAFAGASLLSSFLYGIQPRAIGMYLAAGAVLLLASAAAGWLAARRTTTISPSAVLRAD